MGKSTPLLLLTSISFLAIFPSCKDDTYLTVAPPVPDQSFVEEFDTIQHSFDRGWRFINRSSNIGTTDWEQGSIDGSITAYSSKGTSAGFISSDYQATIGASETISNWAVSPSIKMQNGDKIIFYTRCLLYALPGGDSTDFANRLQVRINPVNDGLDVGNANDPGDFIRTILDINPFYNEYHSLSPNPEAYPARWTRFEATVFGLNGPHKGRFAFRYFVEGAGTAGRGSEVAIDSVAYVSVKL